MKEKNGSKNYDVGIFGWWYNSNYGANLTYYALNRAVQSLGYSVQMLWRSVKNKTPNDNASFRFAQKYYNTSDRLSKAELVKYNRECNAFLLGSDQLWNPDLEKVAGEEFFLSFAGEEKVKLAYAQSLGNHTSLREDFKMRYQGLINRLDKISVREDIAVKLFKDEFNRDVPQVCDPVFLVPKDEFSKLAKNGDLETPAKYVVNFILDPDKEKIDACRAVRKKLGINEYINLTDLNNCKEKAKRFEGEEVLDGTSIENFVKAYENADFIVTDSFHGTCLAIIFNKPFVSIANKLRGVKRFESVLKWLNMSKYLFYDIAAVESYVPETDLDFSEANKIILKGREEGLAWLRDGLKPSRVITRCLKKDECIGCGSCVSVCPEEALSLRPDKMGYYRAEVDNGKCVLCGKCINVCPALSLPPKTNIKEPVCFAVQAEDDSLLRKSSSGGVFSLLSEVTFNNKGKVYGAAWSDDFSVKHISVSNYEELSKLRKSKYMQSYIGDAFRDVKKDLDSGIPVLFSGCPCHIAGLNSYLGSPHDKLITVDLLCGNAPSSLFFKKYMEDNFNGVKEYEFRHKGDDWSPSWRADTAFVKFNDGKEEVRIGAKQDDYQRVYHNHTMCPSHCEKCKYQSLPRFGDITIGDFWGIEKHETFSGQKKGISVVLCNSKKGEEYFSKIDAGKMRIKKEVPLKWIGGNGFSVSGHNFASDKRNIFYSAVVNMPFRKAVNYALKPNHGSYRNIYDDCKNILSYDSRQLHFSYESEYWEEHFVRGNTVLMVKGDKAPVGHYACLPLYKELEKGKKFILNMRFRIRTGHNVINFHIKDSGSKIHQIIYSHKIDKTSDSYENQWIEVSVPFVPDAGIYDEFMIGASQIMGRDNHITFDYINIKSEL